MRAYTLTHLTDEVLLSGLKDLVERDRTTTADLLAHIAEVDDRRLYAPAGCRSMRDYCVRELGLSEEAASKRIQVARKAREYPVMFAAIADGSLHLTGAGLLAPRMEPETVDALLAAAAHKSKAEIELMLAKRYPSSELIPGFSLWREPRQLPNIHMRRRMFPIRTARRRTRSRWIDRSRLGWSDSPCRSRSVSPPTRSSSTPAHSSATRSPRATSPRCSNVRSTLSSASSRSASSALRPSHELE